MARNAASRPARPGAGHVTRDGHLKATLILRDTGGFAGRTGRKWVEAQASGCASRRSTASVEAKGNFQGAVATWERTGPLRSAAPAQGVNTLTVADGINVLIEFGERRSVFMPSRVFATPAGSEDRPGRFGGIVATIVRSTN
jgi:hypothetical protein